MFDNMILNEAYYGKNDTLLECERLLDLAITKVHSDKVLKKVEILLKDLFNFKRLVLGSFIFGGIAGTIPVTTYKFKYVTKTLEMEKSETGIRFKDVDAVEAIIIIDLTAIKLMHITGPELLAIILHEIGHSMQTILPSTRIYSGISALVFTATIIPALTFNVFSKDVMQGAEFINKTKGKIMSLIPKKIKALTPAIHIAYTVFKAFESNNYSFTRLLKYIKSISRHSGGIKYLLDNIKSAMLASLNIKNSAIIFNGTNILAVGARVYALFMGFLKFKSEVLADFISTSYGYGNELTSSVAKIDLSMKISRFDNPINRLIRLPFNLISIALDPHPNNISRVKLIVSNLENELEKSINKEAYSQIKKDILEVKKKLNKYESDIIDMGILTIDIQIFRMVMAKLIDGHDDVKALFFGLKPKDLRMLDDLEVLPVPANDDMSIAECSQLMTEMSHLTTEQKQIIIDLISE